MHTPMTGALMMREHVGALRTVLTDPARHVTLVWRLEEAVTSDVLPLDTGLVKSVDSSIISGPG